MLMNSVQVHRQVSFPSRQENLVCDSLPSFEGQLMTSPNYLHTNTLEIKFCISYLMGNSHVIKQKSLFLVVLCSFPCCADRIPQSKQLQGGGAYSGSPSRGSSIVHYDKETLAVGSRQLLVCIYHQKTERWMHSCSAGPQTIEEWPCLFTG